MQSLSWRGMQSLSSLLGEHTSKQKQSRPKTIKASVFNENTNLDLVLSDLEVMVKQYNINPEKISPAEQRILTLLKYV